MGKHRGGVEGVSPEWKIMIISQDRKGIKMNVKAEIQAEIDAARARWAAKKAQLAAEEVEEAERKAAEAAHYYGLLLNQMAKVLPGWMLEYVLPNTDNVLYTAALALPGCCPIIVDIDLGNERVSYEVHMPVRLECDDFWWVSVTVRRFDDLDGAVDVAAENGESWHEMATEAARRNQLGLRPTPPAAPPPTALEIASLAVENGEDGAELWLLLAIAEELHGLNEVRHG